MPDIIEMTHSAASLVLMEDSMPYFQETCRRSIV